MLPGHEIPQFCKTLPGLDKRPALIECTLSTRTSPKAAHCCTLRQNLTVKCKVYSKRYTAYSFLYAAYSVQCTVDSQLTGQCIVYTVHCTLYTIVHLFTSLFSLCSNSAVQCIVLHSIALHCSV